MDSVVKAFALHEGRKMSASAGAFLQRWNPGKNRFFSQTALLLLLLLLLLFIWVALRDTSFMAGAT